jgi:hypothetical protein
MPLIVGGEEVEEVEEVEGAGTRGSSMGAMVPFDLSRKPMADNS